jgi:nucleoside-diphosphate-sugar epimerase
VGPRGVYDEVKRFAEAMTIAYHHARDPGQDHPIFNSYGPRMRRADERAVPNFIEQALTGKPLAMHGDGMQTRSLCYVDDLIEGIWRYWNAEFFGVMNICNPHEVTVLELAKTIVELTHSNSESHIRTATCRRPEMRRPDISLAQKELGWQSRVGLNEGLSATIAWARRLGQPPSH